MLTRRQFSLCSLAAAVLAPLGLWKAKATAERTIAGIPFRIVKMPPLTITVYKPRPRPLWP